MDDTLYTTIMASEDWTPCISYGHNGHELDITGLALTGDNASLAARYKITLFLFKTFSITVGVRDANNNIHHVFSLKVERDVFAENASRFIAGVALMVNLLEGDSQDTSPDPDNPWDRWGMEEE